MADRRKRTAPELVERGALDMESDHLSNQVTGTVNLMLAVRK
jgi:hypothetical protein